MSKRERLVDSELERRLIDCPVCGGSGFTGPETGYDGVCSECGGQRRVIRRINLMVDSGAFSAWQSGTEVDLDAYIKWLHQHKDKLFSYVVLDVMPSENTGSDPDRCARASYRNLQIMRDAGLNPMPVFHQGESFHWLDRLLRDGHKYIGIGGSATLPVGQRIKWINEVFTLLCNKDGLPCVRTHGFGVGSPEMISNYPFYTVDSTTWIGGAGYGRAAGRDAGRTMKNPEMHIATLGPHETEAVNKLLKMAGVTNEGLRESYIGRARVAALEIEELKKQRANKPLIYIRPTARWDADKAWAPFISRWGRKPVYDNWPRPDLTPFRNFNVAWGNVMNHILNVTNHNDRLMSYLNISKWDDKKLSVYIETGFPEPYTYKGRP